MQEEIDFTTFFERLRSSTPIQNQSQLAEALGVGRAAVSAAKQKNVVPPKWILALSNTYRLHPRKLIPENVPPFASPTKENLDLPLMGDTGLSPTNLADLTREVMNSGIQLHKNWLATLGNPESMVIVPATSDNMSPDIPQHSLTIVDRSQCHLEIGGIYALRLHDEVTIRKIDKNPEGITLFSENKIYPDIHVQNESLSSLTLIGRVVGMIRFFHSLTTPQIDDHQVLIPNKKVVNETSQKQFPLL